MPPSGAAGGDAAPEPSGAKRHRGAAIRFVLLLLLIAAVLAALRWTPLGGVISREGALSLLRSVRSLPAAPLVFVAAYALAAGLGLPGSALTLAGGAIFGLWPGFPLNLAAATLGATLAFLLARGLGRDFVARRLRGRGATLDRETERHGFRAILTLRLIPVVPFNVLNYGAGLSSVRLRDYVLASAIGMLPGSFAYTYFADAILAGSLEARKHAYLHMILAGALLVALSLLPLLLRRRRAG